ncbi:MAG: FGGY family carbohydrate kinase, partial [Bacteroidota bacterium]
MRYLIGIDAGTTSIKALMLGESGEVRAAAGAEYSLDSGEGDRCEVDAEVYWDTTCEVIRELLLKSKVMPDQIAGMAISSQGETLICLDDKGRPLRKAIVWLDNRSVGESKLINGKFDPDRIMEVTGQPEVLPLWPATRILWFREQEPEIFRNTSKYLLVEDYLMYRLTGRYCTEYSLASDTLYFDIRKKVWWEEMLDYLDIPVSRLPELMPSGSPVGNLTRQAARDTGLSAATLCVTGAYDHPAGAIGAGNLVPGMVTLTIGAAMAMCVTLKEPVTDNSLRLSCQCHPLDDLYFLLPYAP